MLTNKEALEYYESNIDKRIDESIDSLKILILRYLKRYGYVRLVAKKNLNYNRLYRINLTKIFEYDMRLAFCKDDALLSKEELKYFEKLNDFLDELRKYGYRPMRFDDCIVINLYDGRL